MSIISSFFYTSTIAVDICSSLHARSFMLCITSDYTLGIL